PVRPDLGLFPAVPGPSQVAGRARSRAVPGWQRHRQQRQVADRHPGTAALRPAVTTDELAQITDRGAGRTRAWAAAAVSAVILALAIAAGLASSATSIGPLI